MQTLSIGNRRLFLYETANRDIIPAPEFNGCKRRMMMPTRFLPYLLRIAVCMTALTAASACSQKTENSAASATALPAAASVESGLSGQTFEGSAVPPGKIGGDFTLYTGHDKPVSLSDFKGKVVVLVFGYTHCPDVCPTNLLNYADALRQLGDKAAKNVQVVMITVDPARDTPDLMGRYTPVFNPTFIGLSALPGHESDIEAVKKMYGIYARKMPSDVPGQYLVDHSSGGYLIDTNGRTAVYIPHSLTAAQVAHDIRLLLEKDPKTAGTAAPGQPDTASKP